MKLRRTLAGLMTAALLCIPALAQEGDLFPAVKEYPGYADVPAGAWYEEYARLCYETGLMTGKSTGFDPAGIMTVAEAATLSARVLEAASGDPIPAQKAGAPWYRHYVDYLMEYAEAQGDAFVWDTLAMLPDTEGDPAERFQFSAMLLLACPEELLTPINSVTALPDIDYPDFLRLYNAGILTGVDKYGTFYADGSLTRQEAAAMISRIARPSLRKAFTPADSTPFAAAQAAPGTVFFTGGKTAGDYIPAALERILALETACKEQGLEFNWFNTVDEGVTFLEDVKEYALSKLGVTKDMGTEAFSEFDLQVFYSRYLDLTKQEKEKEVST